MRIVVIASVLSVSMASSAGIFGDMFGGKPDMFEGIVISKSVDKEQSNKIIEDLKFVKNLSVSQPVDNETFAQVQHVMHLSFDKADIGQELFKWLGERVHYVVGENYELQKNIKVLKQGQDYRETEEPHIEKPTKTPDKGSGTGTVQTVMSNVGAAIYYAGRQARILLGLKIDGDTVRIESSRNGVIQVGSGLFGKTKLNKDVAEDSVVQKMLRMETFFHEARHSDGHGTTLGFFHAICLAGHEYEGYAACDRNQNGPYTVGMVVLKVMKSVCQTTLKCSELELTKLDLAIADSANRVIKTEPNNKSDLILSSIKAYQTIQNVCHEVPELPSCKDLPDYLKKLNISSQEDINRILKEGVPPEPTKDWDDQPESI